jgi:hypothetical protein
LALSNFIDEDKLEIIEITKETITAGTTTFDVSDTITLRKIPTEGLNNATEFFAPIEDVIVRRMGNNVSDKCESLLEI